MCQGSECGEDVNMRGLQSVLNMPEYVLIMPQYAWLCLIMLSVPEYTWINRVLNITEFWICLMHYIACHCANYGAVIEAEAYSEHSLRFKMECFPKRILPECNWICIISLNISKYSWKCLNKLFWLYQGYEYAWSTYMFDRLLNIPWILNMPGF